MIVTNSESAAANLSYTSLREVRNASLSRAPQPALPHMHHRYVHECERDRCLTTAPFRTGDQGEHARFPRFARADERGPCQTRHRPDAAGATCALCLAVAKLCLAVLTLFVAYGRRVARTELTSPDLSRS